VFIKIGTSHKLPQQPHQLIPLVFIKLAEDMISRKICVLTQDGYYLSAVWTQLQVLASVIVGCRSLGDQRPLK